jgi:succinate dehydrogenase / fumarate reductase membrane anchor subunit
VSGDRLVNPLARARGLGSAKSGLAHWRSQRVTAVALALLLPWFAWFALGLLQGDWLIAREAVARPHNALLLAAFCLSALWHAQLGLQVVIEDYVHGPAREIVLQLAVKFLFVLAALLALLSIGRIHFSA